MAGKEGLSRYFLLLEPKIKAVNLCVSHCWYLGGKSCSLVLTPVACPIQIQNSGVYLMTTLLNVTFYNNITLQWLHVQNHKRQFGTQ